MKYRDGTGLSTRLAPAMSLLGIAMFMAIQGCDGGSALPPKPKHTVLLVGTQEADPVWPAIEAGAARFIRDAASLKLSVRLPKSPTPIAQKALLETIGQDDVVHAVCLLAIEARILPQPIGQLISAGMPVVLLGDDTRQSGRTAYVGADEAEIGAQIARSITAMCQDHRTIMVVHDNRASERSRKRHVGFVAEMKLHPEITVLRDFDCLGQPRKAIQIVQQTSERYPELGGWALLDDWLAYAPPLTESFTRGAAKVVSYGAHPGNFHLLERERVHALVGIDWEEAGFQALQICSRFLNRSAFPVTDEKMPPLVVRTDNLAEYQKKWSTWTSRATTRPATMTPTSGPVEHRAIRPALIHPPL